MEKILRNRAQCRRCGEILESRSVHELVWCGCGSIAVDGGHDYLRRCYRYSAEDILERSVLEERPEGAPQRVKK